MHKDDIVVGLGRPMFGTSVHLNRKKAYPSVVTTIVHMAPFTRYTFPFASINLMCLGFILCNGSLHISLKGYFWNRKFMALNNFLCQNARSAGKLKKEFLRIFCSEHNLANADVGLEARNKMGLDVRSFIIFCVC